MTTATASPTPVAAAPSRGMSISSLALGVVSAVLGFTFVVPIVGLVLGTVGYVKEPTARGYAIGGMALNAVLLFGWIAATVLAVLFAGLTSVWAAMSGVFWVLF
jgi:hypothetical protein